MAEGAPLLREYAGKTCIVGSNPTVSATNRSHAFVGVESLSQAPLYDEEPFASGRGRSLATRFITASALMICITAFVPS